MWLTSISSIIDTLIQRFLGDIADSSRVHVHFVHIAASLVISLIDSSRVHVALSYVILWIQVNNMYVSYVISLIQVGYM